MDAELHEKVKGALERARGFLRADGGDVELIEVTDDGTVKVRLMGACCGCPMAALTLQEGIERIVKEVVPEIKRVVAV